MRYGDAVAEIIESSLLDSSRETYQSLLSEDESTRLKWGINYVGRSAKGWGRGHSRAVRANLDRDRRYHQCLAFIRETENGKRRNSTIATVSAGN
jgi:hypothetical protein